MAFVHMWRILVAIAELELRAVFHDYDAVVEERFQGLCHHRRMDLFKARFRRLLLGIVHLLIPSLLSAAWLVVLLGRLLGMVFRILGGPFRDSCGLLSWHDLGVDVSVSESFGALSKISSRLG